jgi:hypothetical protein
MREQDTVNQLANKAHNTLWALFPDALNFSGWSHFPQSLRELKVLAPLHSIFFGRIIQIS